MSVGTILLIAVAVGVTFLMLSTAHGTRDAADRAGEAGSGAGDLSHRVATDDLADNAQDGAAQGHTRSTDRHGCR